MTDKSSFGDWVFLGGAVAFVGGYLAYENMDAVNGWLMAMQTPAATQNAVVMATDVNMGAWMASNWGVVLLAVALVAAVVKTALAQRGSPTGADGSPAVVYRRYKFVNVKLVR